MILEVQLYFDYQIYDDEYHEKHEVCNPQKAVVYRCYDLTNAFLKVRCSPK